MSPHSMKQGRRNENWVVDQPDQNKKLQHRQIDPYAQYGSG